MDQNNNKLAKRMLPFLMKPFTLIMMTAASILGEAMWMFRAVDEGNQWESLGLFAVGIFLGSVSGTWTARLFDRYYVQTLLKRLNIMRTRMGKQNMIYAVLALGVPMAVSLVPSYENPFLPVIQSYIFGFICGTNVVIYLWTRHLPD